MRNTKAVLAAALIAPALALAGGISYATTSTPSTPTRPAVTTTVQASHQHTGQARHDRCDQRNGDRRCDWRGTGNQRHSSRNGNQGYQRHSSYGYQHRGGYGHSGYQGDRGWQGSRHYTRGWGHHRGCCGNGC